MDSIIEKRECYISFKAGIDFFPPIDFKNRTFFDGVFLMDREHISLVEQDAAMTGRQHISYGHPYFESPRDFKKRIGDGNIVFFVQAISPSTRNGTLLFTTRVDC